MVPYTIEELRYLTTVCDKLEKKLNETTAKIRNDLKRIFQHKGYKYDNR